MWILWKRKPSWKPGGPARQEGEKAGSRPQTVEEDRCSGMAQNTGDGLATSPMDVYAQRKCYCALCNTYTLITITGIAFYCICFRKIQGVAVNRGLKCFFSIYRPSCLIKAHIRPEKYCFVWAGPLANHPFNFNCIFLSEGFRAAAERAACLADLYRR